MNPGSEDDGNKQEAVSESIVEIVATVTRVTDGMVTTVMEMLECLEKGNSEADSVEIVTAVTRVTDGMVTTVEMLECLEAGKAELDRAAGVRFFSQALAEEDETGLVPLHSPGRLPGLVQLLADCVGIYRIDAILSINRLIPHYAHILEPTEKEMSSLEDAIDALHGFISLVKEEMHDKGENTFYSNWPPKALITQVPAIIGIFQEPRNRKEAQIRAAALLETLAILSQKTQRLLNESGVLKVMIEAVRVGKDSQALGDRPLSIIHSLLRGGLGLTESAVDWGILEVLEQAVKRMRPLHKRAAHCSWREEVDRWPLDCLQSLISLSAERVLDAILSPGGVVEHLLDMGLGDSYYDPSRMSHRILYEVKNKASESQMRRLMSKSSFFPFLLLYSNNNKCTDGTPFLLDMAQACLEVPGTKHELWLRRCLFDDSGITDAIQRISRDGYYADQVRHIFSHSFILRFFPC